MELVLCLKRKIVVPAEYIVCKGDIGESMYIITHGRVKICTENDNDNDQNIENIILGGGDYFGEQALLSNEQTIRGANAIALSHCELLELNKQDCMKLCDKHQWLALHFLQKSPRYQKASIFTQNQMKFQLSHAALATKVINRWRNKKKTAAAKYLPALNETENYNGENSDKPNDKESGNNNEGNEKIQNQFNEIK